MKAKALSFRQPWAELVMRGELTTALRSWTTAYRGPLAIHAAKRIEGDACRRMGIDRDSVATGALIGLVDLLEVEILNEAAYESQAKSHMNRRSFREGLFDWRLKNPRRLRAPWPVAGRAQLFDVEVPSSLISKNHSTTIQDRDQPRAPFELYVVSRDSDTAGYGLALYQRRIESQQRSLAVYIPGPADDMAKVGELDARKARMAARAVIRTLRQAGYRATDLSPGRREPFLLEDEAGVRMALLFQAIAPVSKVMRIEAIVAGLGSMPAEESYYWYSKCAAGEAAKRARKALRILLAGEK